MGFGHNGHNDIIVYEFTWFIHLRQSKPQGLFKGFPRTILAMFFTREPKIFWQGSIFDTTNSVPSYLMGFDHNSVFFISV
jgi:hypothetical protein